MERGSNLELWAPKEDALSTHPGRLTEYYSILFDVLKTDFLFVGIYQIYTILTLRRYPKLTKSNISGCRFENGGNLYHS